MEYGKFSFQSKNDSNPILITLRNVMRGGNDAHSGLSLACLERVSYENSVFPRELFLSKAQRFLRGRA